METIQKIKLLISQKKTTILLFGLALIVLLTVPTVQMLPLALLELLIKIGCEYWLAVVLSTTSAIATGVLLYWARCKGRILYGVAEFVVATATVWYYINKAAKNSLTVQVVHIDNFIPIAAAIYFIVRGCDNFMEGYKQLNSIKEESKLKGEQTSNKKKDQTAEGNSKMLGLPKRVTFALAILLIFAGFIIAIFYLLSLYKVKSINLGSTFDLETASKAGDFMGGVVGSMWSLAGVLLLIQTLQIQQEEIDSLKKDSAYEAFKSDFLALLGIFQQQKDNFMFNSSQGLNGFAMARADMAKELLKANHRLSDQHYDLEKQLLTNVFRKNEAGSSIIYPDLIFEIYKTINDYPDQGIRERYYRILASTMGVDEKVYMYNSIMLLNKRDFVVIPQGFYYTFDTMPDQHKIFKVTDRGIEADLEVGI